MTLLELLRQELPKRGGWPEGYLFCVQDGDGTNDLKFGVSTHGLVVDSRDIWIVDNEMSWGLCIGLSSAKRFPLSLTSIDHATAIVTREQYEATGWDGTGLPPVGCEVDYIPGLLTKPRGDDNKPEERTTVNVISHTQYPNNGNKVVIATWFAESGGMRASVFSPICLRPLRTEAERAIDEMVQLSGVSTGAAKILYDAGYRK